MKKVIGVNLVDVNVQCPKKPCDPLYAPIRVIYNAANHDESIGFNFFGISLGVFLMQEIGKIYDLTFNGKELIFQVGHNAGETIHVDVSAAPIGVLHNLRRQYQGELVFLEKQAGADFNVSIQFHPVV